MHVISATEHSAVPFAQITPKRRLNIWLLLLKKLYSYQEYFLVKDKPGVTANTG